MRHQLLILCSLASAAAFADTIHLRNVTFDPAVDVPSVREGLKAKPTTSEAYYIVEFAPNLSPATRNQVERATRSSIVAFVPDKAYVVRAGAGSLARLMSRADVAWVGRFEPAYKISGDIGVRPLFADARLLERALGQARLTVTLFDGADPDNVIRTGSEAGFQVLNATMVGPRWVVEFRGSLGRATDLAQVEEVGYIEESADRQLRNDITRWVIQSNVSNVNSIWDRGIHGEGQVAGIIDGGIYRAHDVFRDPVNNTPGPNHRKLVYYSSSFGINSSDSHGTHTGGTLAGDQSPITGSTFRNGMAYGAKLAFTELDDVFGSGLYDALVAEHNAGARVFSNSWGDDGTTEYTSDCQQIDQYSWDHETGMVAFAVTNTSTLKTPENAKSVMAVGATNQAPNQETIGSGGQGPTNDGRRKPEVFAPGIGIVSARNNTTNQWRTMSGTSMACPAVTGGAALIRQYLEDGYLATGAPSQTQWQPTGAMIRAMLMNASVNMTGVAGYPSNQEGWGRLLLDNVLWFAGESRRTTGMDLPNAYGRFPGGALEFQIEVLSSGTPFRATMSFTDYPAQVFASQAAVNDVDLEVIAPDGTVYLGNVFSNGNSVPGGAKDAKNSTEMVILNQPATGIYRVRGIVRTVNQGTRQGFSMVANGNLRPIVQRRRS